MSSSARRTYDTDSITLRTVFAKNPGNSNVPALRVLTADGIGGTYWAVPSSLGMNPSFNEIITSAATYTADLSYNKFRLLAGENIGMVNGPMGSNQTTLYAKAFSQFDVSGGNFIAAFSNNKLDSSVTLAGENGVVVRADPATNTLFIGGSSSSNTTLSTGIYGFNQLKVTPSASTITSSILSWGGDFLTASSPSSIFSLIGYNDIQLSTNVTTNSVFFTISTFTSQGYLSMSNAAFSAYPSSLSTVSSLYVPSSLFGSTIVALSTGAGFNVSSIYSTITGVSLSTGIEILTLQGLVNACATIVQLNSEIANVNSNLGSTVIGLGSVGYISTAGGGSGDVTKANLLSTVAGLGTVNYVSTLSLYSSFSTFSTALGAVGTGNLTLQNLTSTVTGLGSVNYISSTQLASTVSGLGTANYVSSTQLVSTVLGLGTAHYVSSTQLVSTVSGLGSAGYLSSPNSVAISTGNVQTSTLNFKDTYTGEIKTLNSSNNALYFDGTLVGSGTVVNNYNTSTYVYQVSTVSTIYAYDSVVISSAETVYLIPTYFSSVWFSTGALQTSTIEFRDTQTGDIQLLAVNNGVLQLNGAAIQGGGSLVTDSNIASTLQYSGYFSSIKFGYNAGYATQADNAIAIGNIAGSNTQGLNAISIGLNAGMNNQANNSIAIGANAGSNNQGVGAIAIGAVAGHTSQNDLAIGIGFGAGSNNQGLATIAIGYQAGYSNQGEASIAIGSNAGYSNQAPSSIVISALASTLNATTEGFFVAPIRDINGFQTHTLAYNWSNAEIGLIPSGVTGANLVSTTFGLQTSGFLSSANLVSTTFGLQTSGFLSTPSLVSTTFGLQTSDFLSSPNLLSTVSGLSNIVVTKLIAGSNITLTPSGGQGEVTIDAAGGGGGGGITTANLTSTVQGLGTTGYISSKAVSVFVSTLGNTNAAIFDYNIGAYFLFTQNNTCNAIDLPTASASLNGWNVVIKNMPASGASFTVNTTASAVLAPGVATTVVCDGSSFYSL